MMNRPWHIWTVFALCLAAGLGALGWVTLRTVRADRDRMALLRQAALEENVRLAIGRMEQDLAALVVRESSRPYFWYRDAFYPAERAYTNMFSPISRGDVLVPSPLLTELSPDVLLYFQIGPGEQVTSPQSPTGNMRDLAEAMYVSPERIDEATRRLDELRGFVDKSVLVAMLPAEETLPVAAVPFLGNKEYQNVASRNARDIQSTFNETEQKWRQNRVLRQTQELNPDNNSLLTAANVREGVARPVWLGERLLFARRVAVGAEEYVQGCWLNWSAIKERLLGEVRDLLPEANLEPAPPTASNDDARTLAALPARLMPGALEDDDGNGLSAYEIALIGGWTCFLFAAVGAALLLRGTVALSERRAAFVSSVTHELRTPLTTFRMYTEMLSEEMVPEKEKRHRYLATLQAESERLTHLVENVLAYARIERKRHENHVRNVTLDELLTRATERPLRRAQQAGMVLRTEVPLEVLSQTVRADPSAVEQILFNLVDNACKYAVAASDRTIHLEAARDGRRLALRIRDHGPGISRREARRLFRPFSKSARDAAHSAPGVGLGLTLSRRLARQMGGDLRIDPHFPAGACFELSLPLA